MKYVLIFLFILQSCNSTKNEDQDSVFELKPLSPYIYEFKGRNDSNNRIDYYFVEGEYTLNTKFYNQIESKIKALDPEVADYNLYSFYIYKKTASLNADSNLQKEDFDGRNRDLIAYIRFNESKHDIFYILKEGHVIYDARKKEKISFDFSE